MAYTEEELMELIRQAIEEIVPEGCLSEFNSHTRLADICLDDHVSAGNRVVNSADLIHVVRDLEDLLGISVPDDEFFALKTVGDIYNTFKRKLDSRDRSVRPRK